LTISKVKFEGKGGKLAKTKNENIKQKLKRKRKNRGKNKTKRVREKAPFDNFQGQF
jgi:hypothetical protein